MTVRELRAQLFNVQDQDQKVVFLVNGERTTEIHIYEVADEMDLEFVCMLTNEDAFQG